MIFIYTTCQDINQAQEIGEKIVRAKAAGFVNVWPVYKIFVYNNEFKKEK